MTILYKGDEVEYEKGFWFDYIMLMVWYFLVVPIYPLVCEIEPKKIRYPIDKFTMYLLLAVYGFVIWLAMFAVAGAALVIVSMYG